MVDLEDKNRSETPPPSYDEALAINTQAPENPLHPPDGATSNNISNLKICRHIHYLGQNFLS